MADDFNIGFFEASPKTNQNIKEVFNYLVQEIMKPLKYDKVGENDNKENCLII